MTPDPPPAARHVAVAARLASPAGPGLGGELPRRRLQRRMADSALHDLAAAMPVWTLVSLGVYMLSAVLLAAADGPARGLRWASWALGLAAASTLGFGLPWVRRHRRRQGRREVRALRAGIAVLAAMAMLGPMLAASVGGAGAPAGGAELLLGFGLCLIYGLAGVVLLWPLPWAAAPLAALPLVPVLAGWAFGPARALLPGLVAGATLGSVAAALLLWFGHRTWRRRVGARLEAARHARELIAERDAAMRADRDKSRFLAIASHDLRQPVHALGLFAATLQRRLQGTAEEPLVRNVLRAVDGLDRSFTAMLDVSRLDAGTVEPKLSTFPLRDLFRRLHLQFAGEADLKGLGLRFSPGGKSVTSDPQLLERVLANLIQNAMKHTESGGIVVVARSVAQAVNVEIWDTGRGIAADDLPRIFDEFYQVGRGERDRAHGLGMGLAIVKRLALLLGHSLTVSSRVGRGTMFRVGIPLGALPGIQEVLVAADTVPMQFTELRMVLLVDDEEPIREGLRGLLEEWGFQCAVAESLAQAREVLGTLDGRVDLLVSDLHLGDGPDGLETVAQLRTQCGYALPAILITGDTSPEEMQRITASGLPALFKPVSPRKLFDTLRAQLRA